MLALVEDAASKNAAQRSMERIVTAALRSHGKRKITFRGGGAEEVIYSNGDGQLWCSFMLLKDVPIPRFWNAFGIFDSRRHQQNITVEINIPTENNSPLLAGFFAHDPATGRTYLMHDGKVGGGKPGVGRSAFLAWSKTTLVDVVSTDGTMRSGIVVGIIDAENLPSCLWHFIELVQGFKKAVDRGNLDDEEFRSRVAEWNEFRSESSGHRRGTRNSEIDYFSYHGVVVRRLYEEREARSAPGERVLNSPLVDLYVLSGEKITEIYEVKTSLDRQALYTAIGQLITHSVDAVPSVRRVLVIPQGIIPSDLQRCVESLSIDVRHFELTNGANRQVVLCSRSDDSRGAR